MNKSFIAGVFAYAAVKSLLQDYMGKEAYVAYISANWQPAIYTVPLAIVILCIASAVGLKERQK